MCFTRVDSWLWRNNHQSVCKDHVRAPYFIRPDSKRVLTLRAIMGLFYVILSLFTLYIAGKQALLYMTNWNLMLTTVTICLLFVASYKE